MKREENGNLAPVSDGRFLASGFLQLMLSQLSTRILTFVLNLMITWGLSQEDMGVQFQHQLLVTTILFLSREGFRRGCLRSNVSEGGEGVPSAEFMNLAWLSVPFGLLVTILTASVVLYGTPIHSPYARACLIHCVAAVVELLSEPLYILAQSLLLIRLRVTAEGLGTIARCLTTIAFIALGIGREGGLLFGYAYLAYACCVLATFWTYFLFLAPGPGKARGRSGLPIAALLPSRATARSPWLEVSLLRLCGVFTVQSVQKLVLQKGETFVLLLFDSDSPERRLRRQGVYALVENLGSLVVRILFQPLEESVFALFAKMSAAATTPTPAKGKDDGSLEETTQAHTKRELQRLLLLVLKLVVYVGLVFVAFGPSHSYVLLRLLYGRRLSDSDSDSNASGVGDGRESEKGSSRGRSEAAATLAAYCVYVMVMGVNGVTEAFLHAAVSEQELRRSNVWLMACSAVYVGAAVGLIRVAGAAGLVLANCINMSLRILYSLHFIVRYFADSPSFSLLGTLPASPVALAFLLSAVGTHTSQSLILSPAKSRTTTHFLSAATAHVGVGLGFFLLVIVTVFVYEKEFLRTMFALRKKAPSKEA